MQRTKGTGISTLTCNSTGRCITIAENETENGNLTIITSTKKTVLFTTSKCNCF